MNTAEKEKKTAGHFLRYHIIQEIEYYDLKAYQKFISQAVSLHVLNIQFNPKLCCNVQ